MPRKTAPKHAASAKAKRKTRSAAARQRGGTKGASALDYVRTANEATAAVRKRTAGPKKTTARPAPGSSSKGLKREGDKLAHAVRIAAQAKAENK